MFGNDNQKNKDTQNNSDNNGAPLAPEEPQADGTLEKQGSGALGVLSPSDGPSALGDPTPPADTPLVNGSSEPASLKKQPSQSPGTQAASSNLLGIKQQALQQLGPLVDHLDQTPEEKFRTTMMMIQATDDQAMVKDAYMAAKQISDDKVRAQALLDVINEINYFTQKSES